MAMKRAIGIGETVLDILFKNDQPQKAVPGGWTFNSIELVEILKAFD